MVKNILSLITLLVLTASCEQVSKKFEEKNGFKGAPIYVTSRESLVKDIANKTHVSEKQISILHAFGEENGKKKKSLKIIIAQVADSLLNETAAQQIGNDTYLLTKAQIANIAFYDHVDVVLRNEEVNKDVTKCIEYIVNKQ